MGMSASQGRYMFLTARNSDITLEMNLCSNAKLSLNRDARKNTREYNEAMNAKKYVWSNNSGITKQDLTYDLLTTPNTANPRQPFMVTDLEDRVVLNKKYADILEEIAPDGQKLDWKTHRIDVISELTGIPADKIASADVYGKALEEAYNAMMEAQKNIPDISQYIKEDDSISNFINATMKNVTSSGVVNNNHNFSNSSNWAQAYANSDIIDLTLNSSERNNPKATANFIAQVFKKLGNSLENYFGDNSETFGNVTTSIYNRYVSDLADPTKNIKNRGDNDSAIFGTPGNYKVDVRALIDQIISEYEYSIGADGADNKVTWYNIPDSYKKAVAEYERLRDEYNKALSDNTGLLTADEERLIEYYDAMFETIAEKGWVYNPHISDPAYLNEMLQNNLFALTTVEEVEEFDYKENDYIDKKVYSTDFAGNCEKLICVTDTEAIDKARIQYEYVKGLINDKETKIDLRMTDLQTELQANKEMMEGIKAVISENQERTFNIFT